jgi:hypothetical protein
MKLKPEEIEGAALKYAPVNELGVVFLFATIAKKMRMRVEVIQAAFPDCIAYRKTGKGERKVRIEFEYKAKNFVAHKHDPKKCDMIVCWENNWADAPKHIEIIELRSQFGLGFNVWIQAVGDPYKEIISEIKKADDSWSVASQAHAGDLVLFYHNRPDMYIKDIFIVTAQAKLVKAGWKPGMDYMAPIRRVCQLKAPIFFEDLKRDRILKTSGFVRSSMIGRSNATEFWPHLYGMILRKNPALKKKLAKFAPERL